MTGTAAAALAERAITDLPFSRSPQRLRRLDHVFGGNGVRFEDMEGTAHFDDRSSPFYGLSDHAPLLARLAANRAQ